MRLKRIGDAIGPPQYKPTAVSPPPSPVGRANFADVFSPLHADEDLNLTELGVVVQMYGWLRGYLKRVDPKTLMEIDDAT